MDLLERYKAFTAWQKRPYKVAPLSDEEHECPTCGTRFQGNYCPRCGQSARIGRYSFKKALLLFLDVWGLGNRGMFRTLRDLVLRPGYMIRDYLRGMQMADFPPFKMFFLLTTLSLLVSSGFNVQGRDIFRESITAAYQNTQEIMNNGFDGTAADPAMGEAQQQVQLQSDTVAEVLIKLFLRYPSITTLVLMVLLSLPLYLFFRHCPAIPDLRYSELLVGVIYMSNMLSVYSIVCDFFCFGRFFSYATTLLTIVPMKQLTGYSWWRTAALMFISFVLVVLSFILLMTILSFIYLAFKNPS